uniref:Nuclear autoantigenic sperm protein n=1 Tax=Pipistrellus kuhlii TaxID=59472 RepID=A0A7J8A8V0_PIPKU|nr:nuclear autoantigenic sperm protein [Pipistrellus kuhlii]
MDAESTAAAAISAELASADKIEDDAPAPSTSADKVESLDVDSEAKKLLGLGQKHLVMGDIPAAVNAFQEAASLLGKKYGETANECGEAFFFYGKSLLELARMENGVLGNALEGVHVEEEEGEKTEESLVENNDNVDGMWRCSICFCVHVTEIGSPCPGSSVRCWGDNLHRVETSMEVADYIK